jgi:ribonucleoside-diphosphate reductase alpha chain
MKEQINVVKRNGEIEELNLDKIHVMVEEACKNLSNVSASQVEIHSDIQFYNGITTKEIQEILIKSANDLISLENTNYQYVAARLLLFSLRKSVHGKLWDHPPLISHIRSCIQHGLYDPEVLNVYTEDELLKAESFINYDRDFLFTYCGLRQVIDKYLLQNRNTKMYHETPQILYIMIALTVFSDYPKERRMQYVKRYYDAISKHKLSLPTPIMSGVRSKLRQFASCVLVDIGDDLLSIESSDAAIFRYVAQRAGIGINVGRIRGIGAEIRGGEVIHTGLIPYLRRSEGTVRSCTQNGVRGGSATCNYPIWHQEIEDLIVLKNNKGTEDNRVRKLDYCVQFSRIFWERFVSDGDITLFSPNDVPGLIDEWGGENFDSLYERYENTPLIKKRHISARKLILSVLKERAETGRIYIMNIDHCNTHSSFKDLVKMTNLCVEITLPTIPITHIDEGGPGAIALCILSAINVGKIRSDSELEDLCDLAVRGLDALIDYQNYPVNAAKIETIRRRSLGVGYIGLAHYLAKLGYKYDSQEAWDAVHGLSESFQYYLLKASNQLAKEVGPCEYFNRTKYSDGILPIDTYKKTVDEVSSIPLQHDWEELRESILQYGLRNSTLSAQMPSESSSVVSNSTNGIEPPRAYMSIKKSKKGPLKQIVPQYERLKNYYDLLWDMESNRGYLNIVSVMQKFFDQSISANTSYNPENYENNQIPLSVIAGDVLTAYKLGIKTLYYQNTYDGKGKDDEEENNNDDTSSNDVNDIVSLILDTEEEGICDACAI